MSEPVLKINEIRPPNPYDFSSLCDFLEQVLNLDGFVTEYSHIIQIMERHANENLGEGERKKDATQVVVFSDEQFEFALIRAFFSISSALIKFKSRSPQEQDVKRDFLHNDNDGSVKNALTTSGFPDMFGKNIVGKRIPEIKETKISKAILKANSVFERAFYFTLKENELTKKPIEDLIDGVRQFTEEDDLRQYLETLLYKVELATTEKSFNSMKKKIAEPLEMILRDTEAKIAEVTGEGGGDPGEIKKLEDKVKVISEYNQQYFDDLQSKAEVLKDYCGEYFSSHDFIFVEKNLLQFKKAKAEQNEKNSQPLLSDDFRANIERKLMIQLISASKKVYNVSELALLKCFMLKDLVGKQSGELNQQEMTKFQVKKKIILDALKRIRTDMIVEDTCNTASENKKGFIEVFEKELFRLSPQQLRTEALPVAEKKSEDLVSRAKRTVSKKAEQQNDDQIEEMKFHQKVDMANLDAVRIVFDMYRFANGNVSFKNFEKYVESVDPKIKKLEALIKRVGKCELQEEKKEQVKLIFDAFLKASESYGKLNRDMDRLFQIHTKGLVDRIAYW